MKVIVVHNDRGEIVSVAKLEPAGKVRRIKFGVGIKPEANQSVLELEVKGPLAKKSLSEIHEECCVELKSRQLVRRTK